MAESPARQAGQDNQLGMSCGRRHQYRRPFPARGPSLEVVARSHAQGHRRPRIEQIITLIVGDVLLVEEVVHIAAESRIADQKLGIEVHQRDAVIARSLQQ